MHLEVPALYALWKALPSAAGAGLCPAGGPQTQKLPNHDRLGRLLKRLDRDPTRKEGAHGGTRGSPVKRAKRRG